MFLEKKIQDALSSSPHYARGLEKEGEQLYNVDLCPNQQHFSHYIKILSPNWFTDLSLCWTHLSEALLMSWGTSNEYPHHTFSWRIKKKYFLDIPSYLQVWVFEADVVSNSLDWSASLYRCTVWAGLLPSTYIYRLRDFNSISIKRQQDETVGKSRLIRICIVHDWLENTILLDVAILGTMKICSRYWLFKPLSVNHAVRPRSNWRFYFWCFIQ